MHDDDKGKVESRNMEETRKIGTGVEGEIHAYSGKNRAENEFLIDNTPEGRRERERDEKEGRKPERGWKAAKPIMDPDSK